jgi:hypothetical protein
LHVSTLPFVSQRVAPWVQGPLELLEVLEVLELVLPDVELVVLLPDVEPVVLLFVVSVLPVVLAVLELPLPVLPLPLPLLDAPDVLVPEPEFELPLVLLPEPDELEPPASAVVVLSLPPGLPPDPLLPELQPLLPSTIAAHTHSPHDERALPTINLLQAMGRRLRNVPADRQGPNPRPRRVGLPWRPRL